MTLWLIVRIPGFTLDFDWKMEESEGNRTGSKGENQKNRGRYSDRTEKEGEIREKSEGDRVRIDEREIRNYFYHSTMSNPLGLSLYIGCSRPFS